MAPSGRATVGEQGHAWAQAWLGRAFLFGIGVQQDLRQGVLWIRRAAESGVALAQFELAPTRYWPGVPVDGPYKPDHYRY